MDIPRISGFPKEERFEIEEDTLRRILSKLLSEFNLQQKSMEKTYEGDYIVTSYHRILNKDVKTLVRVSSHHIGLEREDIEDLQEDMLQVGAISGIFITPAYFTKDAQKYAKHLPIRLVNGTELLEFVEEYKLEVKGAFLTGVDDQTIVNYFKGRRRTKFFGLVDAGERIVEIDKRYLPLAHFRFRKSADRTEVINNLYVDLHNCYVLYLEEADIERNDFIKRIMDLPKESRDIFVDLLKHGELKHEYIKGKHLNILEKQGLVMKTEKGGMRAVDVILDEVSDTISIATSEATTMGKAKPIERERVIKAVDNVRAVVHKHKPEIDRSFDLVHFIEFSTEIDRSFDPDSIKYPVNEIDKILVNCYKDADISYEGNVYLPYYRCKYVDVNDNERFDEVIAPEFKPFMPRPDEYYKFYRLIDKFPAVP
ncbi:MAG TPA: hypothetical protein EYP86_01495, partial [Candidatus Altiarchaeales archaeon]|nr:hypothetical protein [Candidatus Altiarchaeales archaeon]